MVTSEIVTTIICSVLGSGVVSTLVTWLLSRVDKNNALRDGVRMSLLINLQNFGEKIVNKGYCTHLEYRQFCDAYDAYKKLDGDGYADSLKEAIETINTKSIEGGIIT